MARPHPLAPRAPHGAPDSRCVEYPLQDAAILNDRGNTSVAWPYDARCGNVHFPPNATWHYEYGSAAPVLPAPGRA